LLLVADRFKDQATFLGSSDLNMPASKSGALLVSFTFRDHFLTCFLFAGFVFVTMIGIINDIKLT